MNNLLRRGAIGINRRRFLKRGLSGLFAVFAGLAAASPPIALAAPCVGPMQTGSCGSCNCNGRRCRGGCGASCQSVVGFCGASACWSAGGGRSCCDCQCRAGSFGYYCYCYGQ
jgi:hypothetical protein